MLSLSISSSIPTSPKSSPHQSNPSTCLFTTLPLPVFPGSPTHRRITCASTAVCSPVETSSCTSFYDVLGITAAASGEEIKAAYRRLARSCHPDVAGKDGVVFIRVHDAYETLSDPDKRADYDRSLFFRSPVRFTGLTGSPGFTYVPRKNWETDQCW